MASSSGNSCGIQNNSGSEEERKRKRMESNRESAKRSRMRKQKHMDDLLSQVNELRKDNTQILSTINLTSQLYLSVEAENSVLKAQLIELNQRLDSLNEILNYIDTTAINGVFGDDDDYHHEGLLLQDCVMNSSLNLVYLNQPIMASPEMFQY